MDRIVTKALKVDFHIHSHASSIKDGVLVKDGTKDNIGTLISPLKDNGVDMFAITDHDSFDKELYLSLKEHENVDYKKVLPGIEFSVWMEGSEGEYKEIHVIALFDDSSDTNIDKLDEAINKNHKVYDVPDKQCYTKDAFETILRQIGLSVVLIAHQKSSIRFENDREHDVSTLGEARFGELINIEYFDSLEFKTPKQSIFHKLFVKVPKKEIYEKIQFITGSDCHVWSAYPKHDPSDSSAMYYSYLKCLPTFRGLVMAVTDLGRISNSSLFFDNERKVLDSIKMTIDGNDMEIPLSKGINVIIGDNSIGKSLLLHKLTDYSKIEDNSTSKIPLGRKTDYESFLDKNNIDVINRFEEGSYEFLCQGEIRHLFEEGNLFSAFESSMYPEPTSSEPYISILNSIFDDIYFLLNEKFAYDEVFAKQLIDLEVVEPITGYSICTVSICPLSAFEKKDKLRNIVSKLKTLKSNLESLLELPLNEEELSYYNGVYEKVTNDLKKYTDIENNEKRKADIITALNSGITDFNNYTNGIKTEKEEKYQNLEECEDKIINAIGDLVSHRGNILSYNYDSINEVPITFNKKPYGKVVFNSVFKGKQEFINVSYVKSLLNRVMVADTPLLDTSKVSKGELNQNIKESAAENGKVGTELLKAKIDKLISDDFVNVNTITKNGELSSVEEYSAGFNATEFFYLKEMDNDKRIFLIDQPEDDVSQPSIASSIVPAIKHISLNRQVIMVTHNPQFVVNIDADNVIYLSRQKGKIKIVSGALEYKNEDDDILTIVENNLDGGEESIKKRWKRYEKSNSD